MNTQQCSQLLQIRFSAWHPWSDKATLPERNKPGVYIIGRFANCPPAGAADPSGDYVVYIGRTLRRVSGRFGAFSRRVSALGINDLSDHYLAMTATSSPEATLSAPPSDAEIASLGDSAKQIPMYRKFLREQERKASSKSAMEQSWVKLVERWLLYQFVLQWDKLPKYNKD